MNISEVFILESITPLEVKKRIDHGETLAIIDVREAEEIAEGMIPGAKHIPLAEIPARYEEIPNIEEVILVCRSGARSSRALAYLESLGYKGLKNMTGGMLAWPD
jgi:rhodanese-related sulfurtransferase